MADLRCFIKGASSNGATFCNAVTSDLLIYTESNSQNIYMGKTGGSNSVMKMTSNTIYCNTDVTCSGNVSMSGNLTATSNITISNVTVGNMSMFRNRIINGDMRINQRGINSLTTGTGVNNNVYMIDQFLTNSTITTGGITQSNIILTSNDTPYSYGFRRSWRVTASTACTNFDYIDNGHFMEGYNMDDFNWGTAYGSSVTLSYWLKTNAATNSKIPFALRTYNYSYSYVSDVTVASSGNWQYVSRTIVAPANGSTWLSGINRAIVITLGSAGFSRTIGTSNAWVAAEGIATTSSTNIWQTLNNYIEITGLQLEKGSNLTPFEFRPYTTELQMCQRYLYGLRTTANTDFSIYGQACVIGATNPRAIISLPVPMRSSAISLITSQGTHWYGGAALGLTGNFSNDVLHVTQGATRYACTAVAIIDLATNFSTIQLNFTGAAGMTTGQVGSLATFNTKSCYILISSEIQA